MDREVIDVDDDDDNGGVASNISTHQEECIANFRSVLCFVSPSEALRRLASANWNVERAVQAVLDGTKLPAAVASSLDCSSIPEGGSKQPATQETESPPSALPVLSYRWHKAIASDKVFVDSDFPPTSQSLDGRERQESAAVVKCVCGLPAAAKQVQADGPNYGRFYLSCGRPKQRTRVPVVKKNEEEEAKRVVRNPYAKKQPAKSPPTQRANCGFFQWDTKGSVGAADSKSGYSGRYNALGWRRFGSSEQCVLYKKSFDTSQVMQGAVGNCWFLSALAVVAEKSYLIETVMPHRRLNEAGCYQVNLYLDGKWEAVLIDSNIPVLLVPVDGGDAKSRKQRPAMTANRGGIPTDGNGIPAMAFPAFCAAPDRQVWAPLVEKAYAKAHGSYQMLSGGFIQEGLQDLTGAPSETVVFQAGLFDRDTFWTRLLSFYTAGFLMGVATARGGDGLVGGHAYSVLEVLELPDMVIGAQAKVTDYFGVAKTVKAPAKRQKTTVRLVRIRNPWGKREWKGDWSADSEQWTQALRSKLGSASTYRKGDGTFYMSFEDMLERFHHMDVAKTQQGWVHNSADGLFVERSDPIKSSRAVYTLSVSQPTQTYVTVIQPKKRSKTGSSFWYCDPSLILMKRKRGGDWLCDSCVLSGVKRQNHLDVFLSPDHEYVCVPFSCVAGSSGSFSFRLSTFSSKALTLKEAPFSEAIKTAMVRLLHKELLARDLKLIFPVASGGVLTCVHGDGVLYFVVVNGASDHYLSLKIILDLPAGLLIAFGGKEDSFDVAPRSQKICLAVSTNGKQSTATDFRFRYMASFVTVQRRQEERSKSSQRCFGSSVELGFAGDLLTSGVDESRVSLTGGATIDTALWIPQLGASN